MLSDGVKPRVWGIDAINSSRELILRLLVIDDTYFKVEGTVPLPGEKQPAAASIGRALYRSRSRSGLTRCVGRASTGTARRRAG